MPLFHFLDPFPVRYRPLFHFLGPFLDGCRPLLYFFGLFPDGYRSLFHFFGLFPDEYRPLFLFAPVFSLRFTVEKFSNKEGKAQDRQRSHALPFCTPVTQGNFSSYDASTTFRPLGLMAMYANVSAWPLSTETGWGGNGCGQTDQPRDCAERHSCG